MPKKVTEWALKKLVQAIRSMYKEAKTWVQVGSGHSKEFDVGVGVIKDLFSCSFFSIVLDILSEDGRKGALYKLKMTWS